MGLQQDVASGQVRLVETLQHGGNYDCPNVRAVLVLCGQRYREKTRILHVIDANNAHVVGTRTPLPQNFFDEVRVIRTSATHEVLLQMNAIGEQSLA